MLARSSQDNLQGSVPSAVVRSPSKYWNPCAYLCTLYSYLEQTGFWVNKASLFLEVHSWSYRIERQGNMFEIKEGKLDTVVCACNPKTWEATVGLDSFVFLVLSFCNSLYIWAINFQGKDFLPFCRPSVSTAVNFPCYKEACYFFVVSFVGTWDYFLCY